MIRTQKYLNNLFIQSQRLNTVKSIRTRLLNNNNTTLLLKQGYQSPINIFKTQQIMHSFSSSTSSEFKIPFIYHLQSQPQLLKLQLQYRSLKDIRVFESIIRSSNSILQQMKLFKIFKIMESTEYNSVSYELFFEFINESIHKKSDNLLLLLATIKQRIAMHYKNQKKYDLALKEQENALDILQNSMVPPLFSYYSVYREYGLLNYEMGQLQKAKQILIESVQILHDFVSHSDDNVQSNDYCKKQATAYNALCIIDPENRAKWIQRANKQWDLVTDNKFSEIQYAKTIIQTIKYQISKDKEKGQALYNFNLYKFDNKEMKDLLKKAKESIVTAQN